MARISAIASVVVGVLVVSTGVRAQDISPALYQATAIVTGYDMRQRPLGFAETLKEVLVKVSGAPKLADDPRVAALTDRADSLVSSFDYVDSYAWLLHHDDQGTYDRSYELTVRFDPAKIDAALTSLGAPPWRGPRPLLTPIVIVRTKGGPFLLSATTPRGTDMRQTVVRAASADGFGVHFPTEDDLAAWGINLFGFPAPLGTPDPNQVQIAGALDFDLHAGGWIGTWRVRVGGVEHDWQIKGVSFDDAFANMVRGAVLLVHGTGTP